jgi:diguanylate cyclase (GGDEF)-like protein
VAIVGSAGLLCAGIGLLYVTRDSLPAALLFLALSVVTSVVKLNLPLPGGGSTLSISYIVTTAAMLVLGQWVATPIAAAGAWAQCSIRVKRPNPWYQTLFSIGTLALSVVAASELHAATLALLPAAGWAQGAAIVVAATAYFVVNTGLVSAVVSASTGESIRRLWARDYAWSAPSYYIGATLSLLAVEALEGDRLWWVAVLAIPAYVTFKSYGLYAKRLAREQLQVRQVSDMQMAIVEALAAAIEAKDGTSALQSERIRAYSEGLAQAVSMSDVEILGVKTAALLHDIGHLAVPDHILSKEGPLTDDESERMKIHPRVGAEILASVPFLYPVVPLILGHHERWDGHGYPSGLKGEEIPLGARVLAVADCYTAMLAARPYRPARTVAEAIATLRENAGAALDPNLVERFIEVLPSLEARIARVSAVSHDGQQNSEGPDAALADIAVAHREEQLIRDLGQSLASSLRVSDVLSMVSTSLVGVVPLDACALFLADPASGLFLCSHVVGSHQEAIRGITAATVEGLGSMPPSASATARDATARLEGVLVAPLVTEHGPIGALAVYCAQRPRRSGEHARLFARVAEHAANVIANALLFEQAEKELLTDVLTGLSNRRHLDLRLAEEVARVRRHGGEFSVLVLDMDRFKQINDEFGHDAGDSALREVAQVMRASLRPYDACARLAGDEFVLVLNACDRAQAERRRVELQRAVADLRLELVPGRFLTLSVSIGAATYPTDAATVEGVMREADQRMYRDKADRKMTMPGRA